LLEKIENLEFGKKSKIKVKILGKLTYGLICGNCDGCKKEKKKIWRPITVEEIK
jgi:hypothetical protein